MSDTIHPLKTTPLIAAFLAVLSLAVIAGLFVSAAHETSSANAAVLLPELAPATRAEVEGVLPASGTFAPIVKSASPALVSITAERTVSEPEMSLPPGFPFEFFGQGRTPEPQERRQQGLGSGVIVSPEGYILTNNHVIDGASEIEVHLADQRVLPGTIAFEDLSTPEAVAEAIRNMTVRGAPAIGVTAAYGLVVAAYRELSEDLRAVESAVRDAAAVLKASRPTGANLFWAIDEVGRRAARAQATDARGYRAALESISASARSYTV